MDFFKRFHFRQFLNDLKLILSGEIKRMDLEVAISHLYDHYNMSLVIFPCFISGFGIVFSLLTSLLSKRVEELLRIPVVTLLFYLCLSLVAISVLWALIVRALYKGYQKKRNFLVLVEKRISVQGLDPHFQQKAFFEVNRQMTKRFLSLVAIGFFLGFCGILPSLSVWYFVTAGEIIDPINFIFLFLSVIFLLILLPYLVLALEDLRTFWFLKKDYVVKNGILSIAVLEKQEGERRLVLGAVLLFWTVFTLWSFLKGSTWFSVFFPFCLAFLILFLLYLYQSQSMLSSFQKKEMFKK